MFCENKGMIQSQQENKTKVITSSSNYWFAMFVYGKMHAKVFTLSNKLYSLFARGEGGTDISARNMLIKFCIICIASFQL